MHLTTKQKQYLRGVAHDLTPVVTVGKGGMKDTVVTETKNALEAHELIKVRIDLDESADRKDLAAKLAAAADAELAGTIGKIAILYRAREEKPKIKIPK